MATPLESFFLSSSEDSGKRQLCTVWKSKSPELRPQIQSLAKAKAVTPALLRGSRKESLLCFPDFLSCFWVECRKSQPPRPKQAQDLHRLLLRVIRELLVLEF